MSEETHITKEVKRLLGRETEPEVWEVDKQWIKRFAEATDDPSSLWQDERYARKTRYGGIIAPPTFLCALRNHAVIAEMKMDHPLRRALNGGNELEFFQPIRVGDVITVTGKLAHAKEREGKTGKMLLLIFEETYKNQLGELVATNRTTIIRY